MTTTLDHSTTAQHNKPQTMIVRDAQTMGVIESPPITSAASFGASPEAKFWPSMYDSPTAILRQAYRNAFGEELPQSSFEQERFFRSLLEHNARLSQLSSDPIQNLDDDDETIEQFHAIEMKAPVLFSQEINLSDLPRLQPTIPDFYNPAVDDDE